MNITLDRAVIEQALEALVAAYQGKDKTNQVTESITALRTALEQPEQEPVAKYSDIVSDGGMDPRNKYDTAPPQRKPLTDEEIQKMRHLIDWTAEWTYITFARAIEAAHNIKEEA